MKPILFKGEMVRAILALIKKATRRPIKIVFLPGYNPEWTGYKPVFEYGYFFLADSNGNPATKKVKASCAAGDILWVRETWYYENHMHDLTAGEPDLPDGGYSHRYIYRANSPDYPVNVGVGQHGWRPSIFMPKEACRLFLLVKNVRVERLQEITIDGARAEGITEYIHQFKPVFTEAEDDLWRNRTTLENFRELWDSINGKKYPWESNPWVFVIDFERTDISGE